jgi:hypothetical protein
MKSDNPTTTTNSAAPATPPVAAEATPTVAAQATPPVAATEKRQIVLNEVGAKWGKFNEQDLSALKGRDDLVTQVMAKYQMEKAGAQRDVDALLRGRQI